MGGQLAGREVRVMDKYEFNIKVEQIKKLVSEKDYVTAMKIADSIDWSRVRNANLLSMVAGVYEKNGEYQEAKDILLLAFERAPVGKRLLFKLAELSVKSGDLDEAEDFYREFADLAPDDSRAFLLEYLILKAKGAPPVQMIHSLEQYTAQELDERWLYELAELYARAGMGAECVRLCDKITLLFGLGKYSARAMQLKQNFTDLSEYQRDLVENSEKYENNLKRVGAESAERDEQAAFGAVRFSDAESDALANQRYADEDAEFEAYLRAHHLDQPQEADSDAAETGGMETARPNDEASEAAASGNKAAGVAQEAAPELSVSCDDTYMNEGFADGLSHEVVKIEEAGASGGTDDEVAFARTRVLDEAVKEKLRKVVIRAEQTAEEPKVMNADVAAAKAGAMAQAAAIAGAAVSAAGHAEKAAAHSVPEIKKQERPQLQARVGFTNGENSGQKNAEEESKPGTSDSSEVMPAKALEQPAEKNRKTAAAGSQAAASAADTQQRAAENARKVAENGPFHMIIEAETAEDGLVIAIDELKYIHNEYGITNAAAKTTAEKLNERGFSKSAIEKLRGRDFIVEHAGALEAGIANRICELVETDQTGMIIVLVDTPEGLDKLEETCPDLFDLCDLVSDECTDEPDGEAADAPEEENAETENVAGDPEEPVDVSYEEEPYEDTDEETAEEKAEGTKNNAYDGGAEAEVRPAAKKDKKKKGKKAAEVEAHAESRAAKGAAGSGKESFAKPVNAAPDEELEIDDFAQYCCQYASSIDCSITGKSMLALYERIELMEEDNIPLTKKTAEDLIEEAADRAEKPPIGKRLKGMFNSKYDKNGLLILREEDFIH